MNIVHWAFDTMVTIASLLILLVLFFAFYYWRPAYGRFARRLWPPPFGRS